MELRKFHVPRALPAHSSWRCSGLDNVVFVTTVDAVLVARREASDGFRGVVGKLKEVAPALTEDHLKVHRPWGSYQSLDQGERYKVKRIVMKQGGRLSLQMHPTAPSTGWSCAAPRG